MKFKSNPKYNTIAAYSVGVFAVCLALVAFVFKYSSFLKYARLVAVVFSPVVWGLVIAFLLNPVMMFIEHRLGKLVNRKSPHPKLLRAISLILSIALLLTVIISLVANIIPQLIDSIKSIFTNMDLYLNTAQQWANKRIEENDFLKNMVQGEFVSLKQAITDFASRWQQKINLLSSIAERGISILVALKDFVLGLILAIYMLASKEIFISQGKKALYSLFPVGKCNRVMGLIRQTNRIFTHYLAGTALDSMIIGFITFAVLTFAKIPYVVLISLIIGVTNMIPFFGPFIGAVPSALIIFFAKPEMTIPFAVFILILQQLDGNFLTPAIHGESLGISAFWIMTAIIISGGLFGFAGMVLAVPVFAVLYTLVKEGAETRLRKKALPTQSSQYINRGNIEPEVPDTNDENNIPERTAHTDDDSTNTRADSEKET